MQIFIGADHRGFELKNALKAWLIQAGHEVTDAGAVDLQQDDDYPEFAFTVGEEVAVRRLQGKSDVFGIMICGSGVGADVAVNKVRGARASLIHTPEIAKAGRNDDDVNVLVLGADFISADQAIAVVKVFLETPFEGADRHQRRLDKIAVYERQ